MDSQAETQHEELEELVETWRRQQAEYPHNPEGDSAAAAVRCCADELEEVLADE